MVLLLQYSSSTRGNDCLEIEFKMILPLANTALQSFLMNSINGERVTGGLFLPGCQRVCFFQKKRLRVVYRWGFG